MSKQAELTDVSDCAVRGTDSFRNVCDIYHLESSHDNKTVQNEHICTRMFIALTSLLSTGVYSSFQIV